MTPLLLTLALTTTPPEVALLCSRGDGDFTELRFQRPGADLQPAVAGFHHVRRATALGALLPGTRTVLAVAQTLDTRDASFASSLVRLEPGREAVILAEHLALSSRPFVTPSGRVFVQRGTFDEVDPRTGALRTVHRFDADLVYPVGTWDNQLLLYRVARGAADLVAVHPDALGQRVVLPRLPAMARDFALSGDALYFTQIDGERWAVQRLDLRTLELATVARGPHLALLPTPFPSGLLAFSPGEGQGLRFTSGASALAPQGKGFDRVRFFRDGWALGLDEVPADFPTAFATELATGRTLRIAAPAQSRLDIAGAVQ
jgi:hypothetical protein